MKKGGTMEGKKKKIIAGSIVTVLGATVGAIFLSKKKKAKREKNKK